MEPHDAIPGISGGALGVAATIAYLILTGKKKTEDMIRKNFESLLTTYVDDNETLRARIEVLENSLEEERRECDEKIEALHERFEAHLEQCGGLE